MKNTNGTISDEIPLIRPSVQVSGITAEYSVGQTPTGEWFALGTLRAQTSQLIIGTGPTETDAIEQLTHNLNNRLLLD